MHVCGSGARNWRVRTHKCANFIMHEKVDLQNLLMVNMVQKSANYEEIKAKMVNTVFAIQFTSGCKFGGKRDSYHLCPSFDRSLDLFCTMFAMSKFV